MSDVESLDTSIVNNWCHSFNSIISQESDQSSSQEVETYPSSSHHANHKAETVPSSSHRVNQEEETHPVFSQSSVSFENEQETSVISQEEGIYPSPMLRDTTRLVQGDYPPSSRRESQQIQVITNVLRTPRPPLPTSPPPWFEEYTPRPKEIPTFRHTVRRDNRLLTSSTLPVFSAPNCRSIGPKLNNIIEDMRMRGITCLLASETWEKSSNKKYQKEVERLFEIEGLKMISNPRKYRRGGGVCILADITAVNITPLNVQTGNLEIIWALVKPLETSSIKEIITFSFYLPPKSKAKSRMTDHIVTTLHQLLTTFPQAGIMGGGDRNDWNVSPVLAAIPRLLNLQQLPTLNGKNLDVFLSNLGPFYSIPVIVSPVQPDDPSSGKPGDHDVPVIYPLDNLTLVEKKEYRTRTCRPLPESGILAFGRLIVNEGWETVQLGDHPTTQDQALQSVITDMLDQTCPLKTVKLRTEDKPYITKELKVLDRRCKREYRRHGRSPSYLQTKSLYERKMKGAAQDFLDKSVRALKESAPGKAYRILKRLGAQPGDKLDTGIFEIPEHISLGLTAAQSADRIAQKFSEISQEFPPLKIDHLPDRVFQNIKSSENVTPPHISRGLVEDKIKKAKMTKGGVPGDLPSRLTKEFGPEIAIPAARIFNNISQTGDWPARWKVEHGLPLNKVKPLQPESESDLRIISLTAFLSKTYEKIVMDWLLHFVGDQIDTNQYGGTKGKSINHYLIDLITFILYNQDLTETRAVIAAMIDFEKAFNRQNHNILITILSDMGVPGWLLKIVMGFLTERTLIVSYKGEKSTSKEMPGGGPQGTILGMFLFLILINSAGFADCKKEIGKKITKAINKRDEMAPKHWKYVDDLTLAEALDLKVKLVNDPEKVWSEPLNYHNRTKQILPANQSKVQDQLNKLQIYADQNEMKINYQKSKVMLFNTAKINDFTPEIKIGNETLDVVNEMKLLGVKISTDLKWHSNTEFITKKAYSRLWLLRRLKLFGANQKELLDVYCKQIRSTLEFAAVVWHAGLTQTNTSDIERVQKSALAIILGSQYTTYENALKHVKMESLRKRRESLSLSFGRKTAKTHPHWFEEDKKVINTRGQKNKYKNVTSRTRRFRKSAIPYLTSLLNQHGSNSD